jgi:hypothetical protein
MPIGTYSLGMSVNRRGGWNVISTRTPNVRADARTRVYSTRSEGCQGTGVARDVPMSSRKYKDHKEFLRSVFLTCRRRGTYTGLEVPRASELS